MIPRIGPTSEEPRVFALVLSWNARDRVIRCLDSLLDSDYPNLHIVVVDNGSSDATCEALHLRYGESIEVIALPTNLLFVGGNNVGLAEIAKREPDYVLLLNDDTLVAPTMISEMVATAEADPRIGIVGPKIHFATRPGVLWYAGGLIHLHKGLCEHIGIRQLDRGQYDELRDVDYVPGCALMMRGDVLREIGLLDPIFTAYYEDVDWCVRAARAGHRIVYQPRARMAHEVSAAFGGQLTWRKIHHKLRGLVIFARRYARWYHAFTIPIFVAADAVRVAALACAGGFAGDAGRDAQDRSRSARLPANSDRPAA